MLLKSGLYRGHGVFNKEESEVKRKKKAGKKQAELRYSTLGHTYVDVPLTSGIGSSEYSLIKDLHAGLG